MRRRWFVAAITAVALSATGVAVYAHAADLDGETPKLHLLEPSGEAATGVTTVHLTDSRRADPWVPEEKRQLMVSLYYPAKHSDAEPAEYMTAEESELFLKQTGEALPPDLLSTVGTNAVEHAKPVRGEKLPLVVLSPGFSFPRATLTGVAEELASQGTVVALVGHNYEAPMTLPDGETTECVACETEDYAKVAQTRAKDLSFVVDKLLGASTARPVTRAIDDASIAVGGHSIGGASAYTTMLADDRFDAGFNLDGTFFVEGDRDLDRPFLMLGADEHGEPGGDESWDATWPKLTGWKRWLSVDDTDHSSMTDLSLLTDQAGFPGEGLDGERCTAIAREYLSAFVDTHLRGEPAPVLDGPSDAYPEVRFHSP